MAQPQKQATSILLCLIAVALTFLGGSWWITKHFCSENEASSAESAGSAVPQDSEAIIDKLVELRRQLNRVKAYCSPRGIEAETIERYRNALRQAILELQSDGLDNTSSSEIATALDALARGETRPIEAILERGARREALPNAKRALADLRLGAIQSARDLQAAERTYRKATQLDPLLAEAWYQLGGVLEARLNWKGAHDAYLEGLDAVRDERGRGIVYWKLGHVTLEQGAHDGAIAYLNKAEEIFRALDEKPWRAFTHEHLGAAYERRQIDMATSHYRTALRLFESVDDKSGVGRILTRLGAVDEKRGDVDSAITFGRKALHLFAEEGDECGVASASLSLGNAYLLKNELEEADEFTGKALKLYEKLGDEHNVGVALGNMANVYRDRGQYDAALEFYERSLAIGEVAENKRSVAIQHAGLGIAYAARGERDRALQHHERALTLYAELGDDWGMAVQHSKLGDIYQGRGQADAAVESYTNAARLFKAIGADGPARLTRLRLFALTRDDSEPNLDWREHAGGLR